ncbi:MAG TPA: translation initiation factor 2 [Candidatus Faecousia faecigallinarum]|nr:translation initiation factor 2 [Candidatus Faecousia faecigallinarum]
MVKGVSRQVIMVRSPDPELFEEAIFILRADALGKGGVSDREILRQARQAAGSYLPQRRKGWSWQPLWLGLGAAATGVVWLLTVLL